MEGGQLPKPRWWLRATTVDNVIFVTGGDVDGFYDYDSGVFYGGNLTTILSWDPLTESWLQAGDLEMGRYDHAAVAIPSSIIECSGRDVK